jgi:hypothetical protein
MPLWILVGAQMCVGFENLREDRTGSGLSSDRYWSVCECYHSWRHTGQRGSRLTWNSENTRSCIWRQTALMRCINKKELCQGEAVSGCCLSHVNETGNMQTALIDTHGATSPTSNASEEEKVHRQLTDQISHMVTCSPYVNRRFEEIITAIFRVEYHANKKPACFFDLLYAGFFLVWFSTLKIKVICSSETSVHIQTTRCFIPKMATFITTTVRTSNATDLSKFEEYRLLGCYVV